MHSERTFIINAQVTAGTRRFEGNVSQLFGSSTSTRRRESRRSEPHFPLADLFTWIDELVAEPLMIALAMVMNQIGIHRVATQRGRPI